MPKIIAQRSLIALLCIGFGILVAVQLRSIPTKITNPVATYTSLKETINELNQEQDELKKEIEDLHQNIQIVQQKNEENVLSQQEIASINLKKAKAGVTRLNGPGIIITLDDSHSSVVSDDSIVHASDIRDIINLLWSSGAEAISVNGQRVTASTAIDCIVNTILINNIRITNPFNIEAIGPAGSMYGKIMSRHILTSIHQRQQNYGLVFVVVSNNDITVPIYNGSFDNNNNTN